jgi:hypothetical protein
MGEAAPFLGMTVERIRISCCGCTRSSHVHNQWGTVLSSALLLLPSHSLAVSG